ncbi:ATP-binding cassette domain-containing protein [Lactobacillus corticis]|uniref:ABC transporter ATP-binding protein n=1 Tax=Lactobacillus corticis TaxID=2201249 RepID=A0A916VGV5_9LACO|nr:ATP-binding cassette domain-containing protein [Lactobacillus corticis]GFZ26371.1 ABC transporter ATP-binding protein [Lactobacillus corticis]
MNNAVELSGVSKSFNQKTVFENLHLKVPTGKITTIYGKSGSGKSTLLNIIGLLEKPNSGEIKIFGQNAPKPGSLKARKILRTEISYLFQNYALLNDQSVKRNLALANLQHERRSAFEERKQQLLEQLELDLDEKQKGGQLSGGQQQRIALVRAILKPCKLLLCDEPTGSLDPGTRDKLLKALRQVTQQGKTILIVSHDPEVIKKSDLALNLAELSK